jgi:hypothetical protein
MIADMFVWALDHPPPAVYLLIYGDINYTNTLHLLQMRMYTILLAQIIVSAAFAKATKYVWYWPSLSMHILFSQKTIVSEG